MIKLNRATLEDKIYACWLGKNIGGTLGGPFENKRSILNVEGFTTPPGEPLPNDDLDLQLIWLKAIEENGKQKLNERVLGEYWMEYISPYWNEYGVCKSNMRRGLVPPISGEYDNEWKHSNGAWIRTEVWACLTPCMVEDTIRFGYMDACVDHGMGEGTYATIFVAALESAAFAVSDLRKLISIGLSKIPNTCRFYKNITMVLDAYDNGKTWQEARNLVTDAALADPELGWFQAPANVAYAVIGMLWGACDFKKSMLIAINCGDDTDCSAATVGSILGIMYGTAAIPEDWQAYIGDKLITIAINRGAAYGIPTTCTALAKRILALHPEMMRGNKKVCITDGESEIPAEDIAAFEGRAFADSLAARSAYSFEMEFILSKVLVEYDRAPEITANGEISVKVTVQNKFLSQKHFDISFLLPEGWTAEGERQNISVKQKRKSTSVSFVLRANENVQAKNRAIIQIACEGHPEVALVPLVIFG